MNQTKLNDKIYGRMFWEEWDEFQSYWYAPMSDEAGGKFDLLIRADSPLDFLTVGGTHKTFYKLLADLPSIRKKTVRDLVENEEIRFPKSKHKKTAMELLEKELKLISIKIFGDLSSEIIFDSEMFDETDNVIFTLIDKDGEFIEAEISEL